jgi:serine/threonine protein kinase
MERQCEKVKFNQRLSTLLTQKYRDSLIELDKYIRKGSGEIHAKILGLCHVALEELRLVMSCGEMLVTDWSEEEWWTHVISSSDCASVQCKIVLHLNDFLDCIKVLKIAIAEARNDTAFVLSTIEHLELSEADVEEEFKEDNECMIRHVKTHKPSFFSKCVKAQHHKEGLASHFLNTRRSTDKDAVGSLMHSDVEIDLHGVLGKGASGTVFKCKFLGVPAAAKVFHGTDTQLVKAAESEGKIFASLQHPNVVRFIGYAINGTQHILVSELMSMDLLDYLKEQEVSRGSPLSLLVAIDIMLQIARAMDYLHQKKVMHRDLKSKNVLIDKVKNKNLAPGRSSLHVKVTDFGLSKLQDMFTTLHVGSTPWMAPEVFGVDNMEYTNSGDVYSFAMVFFEVLTGEIPFADLQRADIYQKIKIGVRPILPSKADVPSYLSAFIERCWATRAEDRPKFPEICQMLVHCKGALLRHVHPSPLKCINEHDAHKLSCALGLQKCLQESLEENLPIQVYSLIVLDAFRKQNLDVVEQYIGCADWIKLQLKVGKHIGNWIDHQADFEQAFELFRCAAEHDNPEALFRLGLCFELGLGTEQNHEEAVHRYQAAIKLEDATCAYVGLGCCYARGHGVPQDDEKANEMFEIAVEKQNKLENLLPCISEMLQCLSQIPNVRWAEEGYIGARSDLKIELKHHAKDPRGTPLLESIQNMLKHYPGTPDTVPEDEEGYKRAVCRLRLIAEYSFGRLLLDGPVGQPFLDGPVGKTFLDGPVEKTFLVHPVRPIFKLGSNIEKETTGDNTLPKPTASPGSEHSNASRPPPTELIFLVSFVVSCFAILVANYAPIAFLGTAMAIGSIVLALIKYRDWMKLPIIRREEVEIEI